MALRGVLNVNKPPGITSYDVIRRIKPLVSDPVSPGTRSRTDVVQAMSPIALTPRFRIGHAGTLDLPAGGVLLVLLGEATRIADCLQTRDKEYTARVRLGLRTDTDDMTGRVIEERPVGGITQAQVEALLPDFRGEIEQAPPVFSALKVQGVRSSDRARRGEAVTPGPRLITIRELELTDFALPEFGLRMIVSRGTYVRSLVRDLGERLGCGATTQALTRTRIGSFRIEDALPEESLERNVIAERLVGVEAALSFLPLAVVGPAALKLLRDGRPLSDDAFLTPAPARLAARSSLLCVRDEAGQILVLAEFEDGLWRTRRRIYADN